MTLVKSHTALTDPEFSAAGFQIAAFVRKGVSEYCPEYLSQVDDPFSPIGALYVHVGPYKAKKWCEYLFAKDRTKYSAMERPRKDGYGIQTLNLLFSGTNLDKKLNSKQADTDHMVIEVIADALQKHKYPIFQMGMNTWETESGCSVPSVRRSLDRLRKRGWVRSMRWVPEGPYSTRCDRMVNPRDEEGNPYTQVQIRDDEPTYYWVDVEKMMKDMYNSIPEKLREIVGLSVRDYADIDTWKREIHEKCYDYRARFPLPEEALTTSLLYTSLIKESIKDLSLVIESKDSRVAYTGEVVSAPVVHPAFATGSGISRILLHAVNSHDMDAPTLHKAFGWPKSTCRRRVTEMRKFLGKAEATVEEKQTASVKILNTIDRRIIARVARAQETAAFQKAAGFPEKAPVVNHLIANKYVHRANPWWSHGGYKARMNSTMRQRARAKMKRDHGIRPPVKDVLALLAA